MVNGRWVLASHAALIVAWPNPPHTGVVGLKLCVRSTNCFPWMTLSASASERLLSSTARPGATARQKPMAREDMRASARVIGPSSSGSYRQLEARKIEEQGTG